MENFWEILKNAKTEVFLTSFTVVIAYLIKTFIELYHSKRNKNKKLNITLSDAGKKITIRNINENEINSRLKEMISDIQGTKAEKAFKTNQ